MFARNVAQRLKPNTRPNSPRILITKSSPCCASRRDFKTKITFCNLGGMDVIAISLWDTQEHAEAYNTAGYPDVLKI
jgi:hypothetical protein